MDTAHPTSDPVPGWSGRVDGTTEEHLRWHQAVRSHPRAPGDVVGLGPVRSTSILGFASDEGVRRNAGRTGAKEGPAALRAALSSLAVLPDTGWLLDAGDVRVDGEDLEAGQAATGQHVAQLLDAHDLVVVLGGGHETAYASYLGLSGSRRLGPGRRLGILNLDAHFDLREADRPSSGTPFLQISRDEEAAGHAFTYGVVGISEPSNTRVLFDRARELGVRWLTDEESQAGDLEQVRAFVRQLVEEVDVLYLTIDLDVLPAAVAPGVSAPAAFGVPFEVIHACVAEATTSGKLALVDVVELNPSLDQDQRTARAAARLLHTAVSRHRPLS